MKRLDITGKRYGRLTAVKRTKGCAESKSRKSIWLFLCDCGNYKEIVMACVRAGYSKSCGCLHADSLGMTATHGRSKSPEYGIWNGMKNRCFNKNTKSYERYGARGITVCERWLQFENFFEDMGERPSPKHSIDRIDNDGHYTPENCRWVKMADQCLNRRSNRMIDINGVSKPLSVWCKELGLNYKAAHHQIKTRGRDPKDVLGF